MENNQHKRVAEIFPFKINRPLASEEKAAFEIVGKLQKQGFESYIAGGAVRDLYLDRVIHDIDIATAAKPEEVKKIFPTSYGRGKAFGVVAVRPKKELEFEVATFRIDLGSADHRRPAQVRFTTAENDARRRDFTINGLFFDPTKSQIIDFVGGVKDLNNRLIRFVGVAENRIDEDYLRMLRAIRFTHRLDFALDFEAAKAIKKQAKNIIQISLERIRDELTLIITGNKRENALMQLESLGLLRIILPEVQALRDVFQPPEFHSEGDVWIHTLLAIETLENPSAELAWTVLLHDVGKPATAGRRDVPGKTKIIFFEHEQKSVEIAKKILERLRFSNDFINDISWAISQHMRIINAFRGMSERKQKKLFTDPNINLLLDLTKADLKASLRPGGKIDLGLYNLALAKKEEFEKETADDEKQQIKKFSLITGNDIMKILKIPAGPEIGKIKSQIETAFLDSEISTRKKALEMIKKIKLFKG